LDAKYRDLWEQNLPREMLYQLAVYALSRRSGGNAAIIYPSNSGGREAIIEIGAAEVGTPLARIAIRPLDLLQIHTVIRAGDQREAERMAREVALGTQTPLSEKDCGTQANNLEVTWPAL
jgi:5-methylcytosine-specific restriction enzyme subunit McrC